MDSNLSKPIIFSFNTFKDKRGFFAELFNNDRYKKIKKINFKQINIVKSKKNVLRGMHYQVKKPIGYLITLVEGKILDITVDIRVNSNGFKKVYAYELSKGDQLFIPPGFAHGYVCLSKSSLMTYFCTETYDPKDEFGFNYDDPLINKLWPNNKFLIKSRDKNFLLLKNIELNNMPQL